MASRRAALAWALGTGAAACSAELSSPDLRDAVLDYFAVSGVTPEAVACPQPLVREAGAEARCTATIDGQVLAVVAAVDHDGESLRVRPEPPTLLTARVEPEIAQTLRGQGHAVTEVRCRGQLWVIEAHAEHHCEVRVRDGRRYAWRGIFSGRGAEHRVELTPWSEPKPEAS